MKIQRSLWLAWAFFTLAFYGSVATAGPTTERAAQLQAEFNRLFPVRATPLLSVDGKTLTNARRPVIFFLDPNPSTVSTPPPAESMTETLDASGRKDAVSAMSQFNITYTSAGGQDPWGEICQTFPESAKTAFQAAASVWSNILQSGVPINIVACWANLGSSNVLGYSGASPLHRDFHNAPRANTWYQGSLANSLAGIDLDPSNPDMYITYNSLFSWYYGTDGNVPANQVDLMSVVLHEIAHGLNFAGSMDYASGYGSYGYGLTPAYPDVYDTLMKNGSGIDLITFPSNSTILGSQLISNDVWFHGSNAMSANGGNRVKIYAPSPWAVGSSYAHLDYDTFKGTANRLMVYAISYGTAIHDPGPVTRGLLQDLGWVQQPNYIPITVTLSPSGSGTASCSPNPVLYNNSSTCTATPNAGYTFQAWSGDCTGATCVLNNVISPKAVTANFTQTIPSYPITVSTVPTGGGAASCTPNPVQHGSSSTCTATPNAGYILQRWSGDCSGATCVLSNVTSAKAVTANFANMELLLPHRGGWRAILGQ